MFIYFTRRLGKLLSLAVLASCANAFISISLFGMISQRKFAGFLSFDPLIYATLWLGLLAVSAGSSLILSKLSATGIYEIRTSLIRRIIGTSFEKQEKAGSSKLYNVLTNDVNSIASTFSELPTFVFNLIMLVACFSYLAYLSPQMFAVLAAAIGISFLVSKLLIARLSRRSRDMREGHDAMMESYKGMLEGSAQLTVDNARKNHYLEHEILPKAQDLRLKERYFRFYWDLNRAITIALILLLLGVLTEASRRFGDHEVLMTYTLIITYCASPFGMVMNLLQHFAHAKVSLRKIESLEIDPEPETVESHHKPNNWLTIRFSKIEYQYPNDGDEIPFVLGPVDFEVRKGEVLFITGGNGSGKSTFIKILLGLHEPTSGKIVIDDTSLKPGDKPGYRALFAMVLPEFYLFRQALDDEGQPANDDDISRLLDRFNLSSAVKVSGGKFDTVRLSQGQKKRLALVSAISQEKDVYVLDEWAADQDPHYRGVFYNEIIPWLKGKGKTVIAVTHDDRYFGVADRRVDFEMGSIRGQSIPSDSVSSTSTHSFADGPVGPRTVIEQSIEINAK